jgi:RNAse (barnase) inhibitor barstar
MWPFKKGKEMADHEAKRGLEYNILAAEIKEMRRTLGQMQVKIERMIDYIDKQNSDNRDKLISVLSNQVKKTKEALIRTVERVSDEFGLPLSAGVSIAGVGASVMDPLDTLTQQIGQMSDAADSAVTMLDKLGDMIRTNVNNPTALLDLANRLDAKKQSLAAAVVRNTPADTGTTGGGPGGGGQGGGGGQPSGGSRRP